jgi:hypothetical protein
MTALQVFPILTLPAALINLTSSYLGKEVIIFRSICRRFRDASAPTFHAFQSKLFVDRYGARADCEKDIPFYILVQRIKSAAAIKKTLDIDFFNSTEYFCAEKQRKAYEDKIRDLELELDPNGVPRLVKYDQKQTRKFLSDNEFLQHREQKFNELVQMQDAIANEFVTKPLNPLHPLQDLRDRCLRLQSLQEERESLSHALQVRSRSNNIVLRELSVNFSSLSKKGVKLAETKINFEGQEIPVVVLAGFDSYDEKTFSTSTVFIVRRKDNESTLGYFCIEKRWTDKRPDGTELHYYENVVGNVVGTLEYPRLSIRQFQNLQLHQDSTTGDRPIMRLLTQLAVEIFQLEAAKEILEVGSQFCDADVYIAGGFAIFNPELRRDNHIKRDIQTARANNKLFPEHRHLVQFTVYLGKSPTNAVSQFVTWNERKEEVPAMVDFSLDHPPITWEEQIAKNRLLPEKGPILPKFFIRDLSRFEKTIQKP